jgi:putative tryptophan/tyrosine transport system substrate-binding protein
MKKIVSALIFGLLLSLPNSSQAQKVYRVGALVADDQFVPAFEGFKKKMGEMGYREGKNILYDLHNARGDQEDLKRLALKLVQDRPDVIVTSSTTATAPVAKATAGTNTPVVFLSAGNPLSFVRSYASSGNNLTGISTSAIDLTEKRMELLKELAPGIKRVISLQNPTGVNHEPELNATRAAARRLGLELVEVNLTSKDEIINKAEQIFSRKLGEAVLFPTDAFINTVAVIKDVSPYLIKEKLPSVVINLATVKAGGLAAYGADYFSLGQQGAGLVDKVLRGVKPADMPIDQPLKLHLVINLKTAKAIGLKISKEILLRADEVIE